MKYILLPILKLVWALILTLMIIPSYTLLVIIIPIYIIWNLQMPSNQMIKELFEYRLSYINLHLSPYFIRKDQWQVYTFPSIFHYIWNIGTPKIIK